MGYTALAGNAPALCGCVNLVCMVRIHPGGIPYRMDASMQNIIRAGCHLSLEFSHPVLVEPGLHNRNTPFKGNATTLSPLATTYQADAEAHTFIISDFLGSSCWLIPQSQMWAPPLFFFSAPGQRLAMPRVALILVAGRILQFFTASDNYDSPIYSTTQSRGCFHPPVSHFCQVPRVAVLAHGPRKRMMGGGVSSSISDWMRLRIPFGPPQAVSPVTWYGSECSIDAAYKF